jgi:hypothetical protein
MLLSSLTQAVYLADGRQYLFLLWGIGYEHKSRIHGTLWYISTAVKNGDKR